MSTILRRFVDEVVVGENLDVIDELFHAETGRTAHIEEVECVRVVDGKIAEMWSVADVASAFLQLGLPVPGMP